MLQSTLSSVYVIIVNVLYKMAKLFSGQFQSGSWELKQSDFPFNLVTESAVFMAVIKITPASGT